LALIVFFALGLVFLLRLRGKKLREEPASGSILPPPPASAAAEMGSRRTV
jgi:UMF1 family MFS transporter